jgi:DNA processing protein
MKTGRRMMGGDKRSRLFLALVTSWVVPAGRLAELMRRGALGGIEDLSLHRIAAKLGLDGESRSRLEAAYEEVPGLLAALGREGAKVLWLGGEEYPELLSRIHVPPPALFVRGELATRDGVAVAIVGSRRASISGMRLASDLASGLALRGVTVVSGLARGIDRAAHEGALRVGGRTIAVLGSGIDLIYPPENAGLALEASRNGAVVSEHGPGVEARPWHFPVRNRIISGLAVGTVVVEAAGASGALTTARYALEQDRSVFAVPGKPGDPRSRGVNRLLKDGARLVETVDDILDEIRPQLELPLESETGASLQAELSELESRLIDLLSDVPTHVDEISGSIGLATGELLGLLTTMETKGVVTSLPGKFYVRA